MSINHRQICVAPRVDSQISAKSLENHTDIEDQVPLSGLTIESVSRISNAPIFLSKDSRRSSSATLVSNHDDSIVCVIGTGYVGEMLVREFGRSYQTIGFDISKDRISKLKVEFKSMPTVQLTTDKALLSQATHFLISVPTLLRNDNSIDSSYVLSAIDSVVTHAHPGSTIIIESSVSVGMTRALLSPHLTKFKCGMSPERVDPGRVFPAPSTIPKIVSGLTGESLESIQTLYARVFNNIVPVSSTEVAEMTKLYENCFRMINIAYVNEMADACEAQGINAQEVVEAASTKPFGYMPFQPGLGVGGHCIPVNPHYMFASCELPLLRKATSRMVARPTKLAKQFYKSVAHKSIRNFGRKPRILVIGVGFKPGQNVLSHSPALQFAQSLKQTGCADLAFYDPYVAADQVAWMRKLKEKDFVTETLDGKFDAIAVCIKQTGIDYSILERLCKGKVRWY